MPMWPNNTYKGIGWKSWALFLNNNTISKKNYKFVEFEEAKKILQKLRIKSKEEYLKIKFKYDLPRNPKSFYKKDYKSWKDFLSLEGFYNYDEAKKILSRFKLKDMWEYQELLIKNKHLRERLPKTPGGVYSKAGTWLGWRDFLSRQGYYDISEAKKIVQKFNFSSGFQMEKKFDFNKFPRMPKTPKGFYKLRKTWKGWPDFLGKNTKS